MNFSTATGSRSCRFMAGFFSSHGQNAPKCATIQSVRALTGIIPPDWFAALSSPECQGNALVFAVFRQLLSFHQVFR